MRIDQLLGLMVEAMVIVFVAKLARDQVQKSRGYLVNQLVVRERSAGAAVSPYSGLRPFSAPKPP